MPKFTQRNGQWQIRFKKSDRTPQEKSESLPMDTPKSKVKQIEGEMNAAYYSGQWNPWELTWEERQRKLALEESGILETRINIEDACKLYVKELLLQNRISSNYTKETYENALSQFTNHLGKRFLVNDLTPKHAGLWVRSLNIKESTKTLYASIISGLYDYLNEKGFIPSTFKYRSREKTERSTKIKYITEGQKDKMVEHYRANSDAIDGYNLSRTPEWARPDHLMNIMFYQGLRLGEICDRPITRKDISLAEKTITVTGKGDKTRRVPITPPAEPYITELFMATNDPNQDLFPYARHTIYRLIKDVAKGALGNQYDWVSPHNFRHGCGTYWATKGVPIPVIQKLLGHTDINTTMVYAQITDSTSHAAFEQASGSTANITSITG